MKLLTKSLEARLKMNGKLVKSGEDCMSMKPVMKLFDPTGAATWLIVFLHADEVDGLAFGLADLGLGFPETGDIYLPELQEYKGRFQLSIERDIYWSAEKTLREYYEQAIEAGRIIA